MFLKRPVPSTKESLVDKANIIELIQFERFCRDNAQWEEMKKCFTADSKVTVSWFQGTGVEFVDASSKMKSYAPHKLNNTLVWINDNKAVSLTMATIQCRSEISGQPVELQSDVKLLYRTEKIDGTWYVVSMDGIYEKDALVPVYPNNDIVVPMEEISKFRTSYANLSYTFSIQGYEIDQSLPGIDAPETVTKLYKVAEIWLNKNYKEDGRNEL